jgi:hypothetical protein
LFEKRKLFLKSLPIRPIKFFMETRYKLAYSNVSFVIAFFFFGGGGGVGGGAQLVSKMYHCY